MALVENAGRSGDTHRPIAIVGSPRSGTTLLASLLNAHPNIAIPPEEDFVLRLEPRYSREHTIDHAIKQRFVSELFASRTFSSWGLARDEVERAIAELHIENYSELASCVYLLFARHISPRKIRWGLKEPYFVTRLNELRTLFPAIQVIHIIRDGRDVLMSMRDRVHNGTGNFETSTCRAASQWKWQVSLGQRFGRKVEASSYFEICYKELITQPEEVLRAVCKFLGETFSPGMFNFYGNVMERNLLPKHKVERYLLPEITSARYGRWQTGLSAEDAALYECIAGPLLESLGYELRGVHLSLKTRLAASISSQSYVARRAVSRWLRVCRRTVLPL